MKKLGTLAGCVLGLALVLAVVTYPYWTSDVVQITIKNKERVVTKESSKYLVFAQDEVFRDTDSIMYLKFNSSDIYNDLDIGKTYVVKVYGWRFPFLSWYRNIVEIERKINQPPQEPGNG